MLLIITPPHLRQFIAIGDRVLETGEWFEIKRWIHPVQRWMNGVLMWIHPVQRWMNGVLMWIHPVQRWMKEYLIPI
ncbi:hypothetical protein CK516_27220 [Nostoc sp. 'Peltigera malacea cyanobiont' DB3992]|nr:hypothetical protein CK516_27220 [Nostoc sp. 'Peltigera malacea cyanobiont' DB3992]